MSHDFSENELKTELTEISRINLDIQKRLRKLRSFGRNLGSASCCLNNPNGEVSDFFDRPLPSAHAQMQLYAWQRERNTRMAALYDRLVAMGCIFERRPEIILIFGLTDAGNPAISIKIDGIELHKRPLTPRSLVPKILLLADLLDRGALPETGPLRRFVIHHVDHILALTPGQALWKWLCLRHPLQAREIARLAPGDALPDHEVLAEALRGVSLHEAFCARTELARARGLTHTMPDIIDRNLLLWHCEEDTS